MELTVGLADGFHGSIGGGFLKEVRDPQNNFTILCFSLSGNDDVGAEPEDDEQQQELAPNFETAEEVNHGWAPSVVVISSANLSRTS